jgi:CDP-diacylglycerol--serine O-phosphatidyltransferase
MIGLLMVSSLPTFSGKRLGARLPSDSVLPLMVAAAAMIALLGRLHLACADRPIFAYLAALPVGIWYERS